ncbi:hypothetical protein ACROYT_G034093 [Oculina patagonica]
MCRDEFRLRNFKLWHPILRDFTHSRWLSLPFFLAYRLIVTGYNFAWLIYNIYLYKAKLFIFLTNWTYLILNLYFLQATTLTFCALRTRREASPSPNEKQDLSVEVEMGSGDDSASASAKNGDTATEAAREEDVLRLYHKLFWLLYIISANAGLLVTVGYWTVLYEDDEPIDANNITKHALNSVFMLIDTFLSSIPVRLFHSVYPLLYIIVYLAFTVAYWQLGGTNIQGMPYIYKLLDYDNIQPSTGSLIGFFLLLVQPVLQLMLFGLVKLRDCLRPTHKTDF